MLLSDYVSGDKEWREDYLSKLSEEELLLLGIDLYNAGHYWYAHEAWEAVWLDAPDRARHFYQGLIQVTAAFVHLIRAEYPGTVRLLEAGVEKLERYPSSYENVALGELVADARAAHRRLVELGDRRFREFDRAQIPPIRLTRAII